MVERSRDSDADAGNTAKVWALIFAGRVQRPTKIHGSQPSYSWCNFAVVASDRQVSTDVIYSPKRFMAAWTVAVDYSLLD